MSRRPMGRPRVNARAYRIIASPYFGVLYDDQLWSFEEWERLEHRRAWMRDYKRQRRLTECSRGGNLAA